VTYIKKINKNNLQIKQNNSNSKMTEIKTNLTVREFCEKMKIKNNSMYIDKFWKCITQESPIIIDDEIIRWLGFEGKICNARTDFKDNLSDYNIPFIIKKYDEIVKLGLPSVIKNENMDQRFLKRSHFIIMKPDDFKEMCMMTNKSKAKEIRKYYLQLEKVFKLYQKEVNKYGMTDIASL
jgi:phage anti-repressor protein